MDLKNKDIQQVIKAIEESMAKPTVVTGTYKSYSLSKAASLLQPSMTPLRNETYRRRLNYISAEDEAIPITIVTDVNKKRISPGIENGKRNSIVCVTTNKQFVYFSSIGLENRVTDEAYLAVSEKQELLHNATLMLLQHTMIAEERMIIGGNNSLSLGITPTPTLSVNAGGNLYNNEDFSVICVALTYEGYYASSVAEGIPTEITRVNADESVCVYGGGSSMKSEAAIISKEAMPVNGKVSAIVDPVAGAVGYAWYWGSTGFEKLGAITEINSIEIQDYATGGQMSAEITADNSKNKLSFDGLITQICKPSNGAIATYLPTGVPGMGTGLELDGEGGIIQIDQLLQRFWDNYRTSPDEILCNIREFVNINRKMIIEGRWENFRAFYNNHFTTDSSELLLAPGVVVGTYLNKYAQYAGGKLIRIRIHPDVPPGTMIFRQIEIPYPMVNITQIMEILYSTDYHEMVWPSLSRNIEFGIYSRQLLAMYAPFCFGMINNIADV